MSSTTPSNTEEYHTISTEGPKSVESSYHDQPTVDPKVPMCGQGILTKLLSKKGSDGSGQQHRTTKPANTTTTTPRSGVLAEPSQASSTSSLDTEDFKWRSAEKDPDKQTEAKSEETSALSSSSKKDEEEIFGFDPDELNTLRAKHLRMMKKKVSPSKRHLERPPKMTFSLPSVSEVPSSQESSVRSRRTPPEDKPIDDGSVKVRALIAMKNVVNKQQESLMKLSEKNKEYLEKLQESESLLEQLQREKAEEEREVADTLRSEKASYEAEALVLRKEMESIRQELAMLRSSVSSSNSARVSAGSDVSSSIGVSDDGAYWKKEWSMTLREADDIPVPGEAPQMYSTSTSQKVDSSASPDFARTSILGISPRPKESSSPSTSSSRDGSVEKEYLSEAALAGKIEGQYLEDVEQARKLLEAYRNGGVLAGDQGTTSDESSGHKEGESKFKYFEDNSSTHGDSLERSMDVDDSDQMVLIENMEKVHGQKGASRAILDAKTSEAKGAARSETRAYVPDYQRAFDAERREAPDSQTTIRKSMSSEESKEPFDEPKFKYQTEKTSSAYPKIIPSSPRTLTKANLDRHESDVSDRRDDLATRIKEARLSGHTKRMVSAFEGRDQPQTTHPPRQISPVLSWASSQQTTDSDPFRHSDTTVRWGNQSDHEILRNKAITSKALESYKQATGTGKSTALFKSDSYKRQIEKFEKQREELRAIKASSATNPQLGSFPRPSRGSMQRMLT